MTHRHSTKALLARIAAYAGGRRRHRRLASMRHLGFAETVRGIFARYTFAEKRWPFLALIFERTATQGAQTDVVNNFARTEVFLNPRLLLQLSLRTQLQTAPGPSSLIIRRRVESVDASPTPAVSRHTRTVREETKTIERIVRRTVRYECEFASARSVGKTTSPSAGIAPQNYERPIVRQAPPRVPTEPGERLRLVGSKSQSNSAPHAGSAKWEASQPPTLDIGSITHQVMQAIDQRIVAHRERMGRD